MFFRLEYVPMLLYSFFVVWKHLFFLFLFLSNTKDHRGVETLTYQNKKTNAIHKMFYLL
jgi:hypothetical protein